MFRVRLRKPAKKSLQKLDKNYRDRILKKIVTLQQEPFIGKPLKGELEGRFTLRVWPYRIIYRVYTEEHLVLIIDIEHRQSAY